MKILENKEIMYILKRIRIKKIFCIIICCILGFFATCATFILLSVIPAMLVGCGCVCLTITLLRRIDNICNAESDDYYILFSQVVLIEDVNDEGGTFQILRFSNGISYTLEGFRATAKQGDYYYIFMSKSKNKPFVVFNRKKYELSKSLMNKLVLKNNK